MCRSQNIGKNIERSNENYDFKKTDVKDETIWMVCRMEMVYE